MTITATTMWLDGALVPKATATAPLMGHAIQRGSLVFDVGSFHEAARGPVLFRAREHVARFVRSTKIVGLVIDHDEETLVRGAIDVVRASGASNGLVRWSALYHADEPDLLPSSERARVVIAAQALQDPPRTAPLRIAVFEDARKAPPEVLSPHAKAAGAYLGPLLARKRAIREGHDEVVLLDRDGNVAEAPVANVFAVVEGSLWTPKTTLVLPGITRDAVITIARAEGIPVREEALPLTAFTSADEAFLTATSLPIGAIGAVNGSPLGRAPGPITERLTKALVDACHGRDPRWSEWVIAVS
jgi:branched-chain amino acid aminotransferase